MILTFFCILMFIKIILISKTTTKKNNLNSINCGFNKINNFKINLNMNFLMIMIMLIIFDLEMIILINMMSTISIKFLTNLLIITFFMTINLIMIMEIKYNKINWKI